MFRLAAVALLLSGIAGGAYLAHEHDRRTADLAAIAQGEAVLAEAEMLQRMADVRDRVDRSRRSTIQAAPKRADYNDPEVEATVLAAAAEESADRRSEPEPAPPPPPPPPPAPPAYPVPASCADYSGNRATGCALVLDHGFGLDQMPCLDNLWTKESGWNHLAQNPYSGAYGIPQALPGDKMASHGDDWRTNPVTQIRWGLSYIDNRYGTPCGAWGFFQANNWY
jgi:hypothetical protein